MVLNTKHKGVIMIIKSGSKSYIDDLMTRLFNYDEKNGYELQAAVYYSYTNDYKLYLLAVENVPEYNKLRDKFSILLSWVIFKQINTKKDTIMQNTHHIRGPPP